MKLRNSILFNLVTSIVLFLSLSSCLNFKKGKVSDPTHYGTYEIVKQDYIKIEEDSLNNIITSLERISQQYESVDNNNKILESKLHDFENIRVWIWIALGGGLISLILSILGFLNSSSSHNRIDDLEEKLKKIKLKFQNDTYHPQQISKNNSSNELEQLKRRIREIEIQLRYLSSSLSVKSVSSTSHSKTESDQEADLIKLQSKKGYFTNPINGVTPYFKKLLQYKEPEARFSAEISNNKAVFMPFEQSVDFNTYISFIDDYRAAIEFNGCDPKQATRMQIIKGGDAEFRDGNWYIIKKALVNLS